MTPVLSFYPFNYLVNSASVYGGATVDPNYPASNLMDLVQSTKVCRVAPASGVVQFDFSFSTPLSIPFVGVVGHNIGAGSPTIRVRLTSAVHGGGTLLYDSGAILVWPSSGPAANFQSVRPLINSASGVQSALIDFGSLAGTLEIASIFMGRYIFLDGMGAGKQLGFTNRVSPIDLVGGGADPPAPDFVPRTLDADLPLVALGGDEYLSMIDMQRFQSLTGPMVYVEDYDDPTTWARRSMLCTNSELPAAIGALYKREKFSLRLREHRR